MTRDILELGRGFLLREGRLLERRLFQTIFEGADPAGAIDVLRGYRNPDGGFGYGLEPDTRCPESLPIYVERALDAFIAAGVHDDPMVGNAVDWLASVRRPMGQSHSASRSSRSTRAPGTGRTGRTSRA
jgi:hypothetical protein